MSSTPALSLPLAVEGVTPEWLTTALSHGGRGIRVRHAEHTGVVWGTATKVLVDVTYEAGADGGLPSRLCVKGGFVPELLAIMALGYQTEARFYGDLAPRLGSGLADCHFAAVDPATGQGIVILDDLADAGATFCDARVALSVDQAAAALELLAGWHSRSEVSAEWLGATPHFRTMVRGLLQPEHWDVYIGQTTSGPVLDLLADRRRIARALAAVWTWEDQQPPALSHGDANLTNVYLDADDRPRFLDWQFVCRTDAYHDVALFLIGALGIDDRRAHEEQLLRHYLDARGAGAESFDQAWASYRRHPLHGAMYALTPEEMQPVEVRTALADRYAQAAIDHGTLELLAV